LVDEHQGDRAAERLRGAGYPEVVVAVVGRAVADVRDAGLQERGLAAALDQSRRAGRSLGELHHLVQTALQLVEPLPGLRKRRAARQPGERHGEDRRDCTQTPRATVEC
jgi:hypothetical protein